MSVTTNHIPVCTSILQAFAKRGKSLRNLITFLLVWATKETITRLFFHCPCYGVSPGDKIPDKRIAYGALFISVPGLILWIIGLLLMDSTWRCLTGCRNKPRPRGNQCCVFFWKSIGGSALAPVTWAVLVFLDGSYLQCVMSYVPPHCLSLPGNTTVTMKTDTIVTRNTDVYWLSAVIGCSIAGFLILLYFIAVVCFSCFGESSFYQQLYAHQLKDMELEALAEAAREDNFPYLKAKWKAMLHHGTADDWAHASTLPYINPKDTSTGFVYTYFQGMPIPGSTRTLDNNINHQNLQISESTDNAKPVSVRQTDSNHTDHDTEPPEYSKHKTTRRTLPPLGHHEFGHPEFAKPQLMAGYNEHSGLGDSIEDQKPKRLSLKKKKKKSKKTRIAASEDEALDEAVPVTEPVTEPPQEDME